MYISTLEVELVSVFVNQSYKAAFTSDELITGSCL